VIDDLQEPAFANRGIIYWVGSYPWILKNRENVIFVRAFCGGETRNPKHETRNRI
jgi:hypothetical protein